ncbi:unnamed protein product [Darwinula stevensoni]|uniref:LON peptidase N-terminal domain and RING finger protein 3 n=1 Tax=Darwinula stevensoni TaxID=69355 RepID=A0A7R8ZXZ5_9CRUS|nr:unnamed protein product [Darwinula stevensoni]CAG0880455.1 unnamed protein product [Darwinula stevensoni]
MSTAAYSTNVSDRARLILQIHRRKKKPGQTMGDDGNEPVIRLFEETLRTGKEPSTEDIWRYAGALTRVGRIPEALDVFAYCVRPRSNSPNLTQSTWLSELLEKMVSCLNHIEIGPRPNANKESSPTLTSEQESTEPSGKKRTLYQREREKGPTGCCFGCCGCGGVFCYPVTLSCGHTFCKRCVRYKEGLGYSCSMCGQKHTFSSQLVVSVIIAELVEKLWSNEMEAAKLRTEGNALFEEGNCEEALRKYDESVTLGGAPWNGCQPFLTLSPDPMTKGGTLKQGTAYSQNPHEFESMSEDETPDDALVYSNRSLAYQRLGRAEEALRDAESAVTLRPKWAKAHYRRGAGQRSLGRVEEAFISFLLCLCLTSEPQASPIISEVTKVLLSVLKLCSPGAGCKLKRPQGPRDEDSDPSRQEDPSDAGGSQQLVKPNTRLRHLWERCLSEAKKLKRSETVEFLRVKNDVKRGDFDCPLCLRMYWQPITTPCGHTFCKSCLERSLDHNPECPLCKGPLDLFLAKRDWKVTQFLEYAMQTLLPEEFEERMKIHEEELRNATGFQDMPIFVCTVAFPSVQCPLHVFEPRYRLMMRRAMESGTRHFGMCSPTSDAQGFSGVGTLLEIRDIQYFPDGRSVVDTIGAKRFRVLTRGTRDGYNTATVEPFMDMPPSEDMLTELKKKHDEVREEAERWMEGVARSTRDNIHLHFGSMPPVEPEYWTLPNGPAWVWWVIAILPLDNNAQLAFLHMSGMEKRLNALLRILGYLGDRNGNI